LKDHDGCELELEFKKYSQGCQNAFEGFPENYNKNAEVYEIKIEDLPKGTSVIRFINSW